MNYTGNIDYKQIKDRQYLTVDTDKSSEIFNELNKQNILYSARYDETKLTVTFSKSEFDKVNEVINDMVAAEQENKNTAQNAADKALEEIQRQLQEMQERQRRMEELAEKEKEQKSAQVQQDQSDGQAEPKAESEKSIIPRESAKLLPIISSNVLKQEQKIEDLKVRRDSAEDKISIHQERIQHLTARAERLSTTNQMLAELMNNKLTPAVVKSSMQKIIMSNNKAIRKIRTEKIPKREEKIEKQQNKIAKFDRKINLAQCKLNRYTSLNNVITSFSLINNSDRRKQFAAAIDNLHKSSVNLYNTKIDISTAKISALTEKYNNSNDIMFKSVTHKAIVRQKISRQKNIDNRNKLIGVVVPMTSQPEKIKNEALEQTENFVNNELKKDNIVVAEFTDNVATAPLPALPEHSFVKPDPIQDINCLLPEIATLMDMSVAELESKPTDIKNMLVLDYTNNFESTPEAIQESLSAIIVPNNSVEKKLEENKQQKTEDIKPEKKENHLKTVEELVEGNTNMIDGVINNLPPEKEKTEENEEQKTFTFSRKQLNENARKVKELPSEHKHQDKEPQNHDSL